MSVIAVKKEKGKIVIGADTQSTRGGYMKRDKSQNGDASIGKIMQMDDLVIGSVGLAQTLQLMSLFLETNKLKNATEREIVRFFKEFETWLKKETSPSASLGDNAFIVISEGKVFEFYDYHISEIHTFWSIGSGSIWALPALELGASVKKAVEVACKYDLYCSGKPQIINIEI